MLDKLRLYATLNAQQVHQRGIIQNHDKITISDCQPLVDRTGEAGITTVRQGRCSKEWHQNTSVGVYQGSVNR